ncbi:MAG TPA: tetratricopeptide repeat protein [Burkholderiales bacterium]|nr:tetratricopeptide repeat protein [Burkholderiales bacterium]
MDPRAKSLNAQGNECKAAGEVGEAERLYREALSIQPDFGAALYNLALCLREGRRESDEAERLLRRVVELDPADHDALFHLGEACFERSAFAEAIPALRSVVAARPDNAMAWLYLGVALARGYALGEAEASLRKAVSLEPGAAEAHLCLGHVLSLSGAKDRALGSYETAARLDPANAAVLGALLFESQQLCEWTHFDGLVERLRQALEARTDTPILPFLLLSLPFTPAEQLAHARRYSRQLEASCAAERRLLDLRLDRKPGGRIRIGYLSGDLREHAVAYLAAEMFELHDRGRFEVRAYSYGPNDRSAMRARLQRAFDQFTDVGALSNRDAARAIHADRIDILVDLAGHTLNARTEIMALRPAPVQASYLGYAGTTGADFVDYLICDRFVAPPGRESDFAEQLVRLPRCFQANDRRRPVSSTPPRSELGLPESGFVFCCFNQPYKILPGVFDLWLGLLAKVPGSVLWLAEGGSGVTANLRARAEKRSVAPERIVFAPRAPRHESHLGRLAAADLFLDTFPFNAHTTASDALWAGLPVLTCTGDTFASRVAGSLLDACGLPELVTRDPAQYEAVALRLAREPVERAAVRRRVEALRPSCGGAFDTPRFVRSLEAAYASMWDIHLAGRPPNPIDLPS